MNGECRTTRQPLTSIFVHETILAQMENFDVSLVIDAGSGTGAFTETLLEKGCLTIMLDRDYRYARSRPVGADLVIVDLNFNVPIREDCVDQLFAIELVEHLWNPYGFIGEVSRVLRDGGTFVMSTPNVENIWQKIIYAITGRFLYFKHKNVNVDGDHFSPIFETSLKVFCEKSYEFISVTYNACFIPFISKLSFLKPLTQRPYLKSKFLGEISIYTFKKKVKIA